MAVRTLGQVHEAQQRQKMRNKAKQTLRKLHQKAKRTQLRLRKKTWGFRKEDIWQILVTL